MQKMGIKVGRGQGRKGKDTSALQPLKLTSRWFSASYILALTHFDKPLIPQTCCIVYSHPISTTSSPTEPVQQLRFDSTQSRKPSQRHSPFTTWTESRTKTSHPSAVLDQKVYSTDQM